MAAGKNKFGATVSVDELRQKIENLNKTIEYTNEHLEKYGDAVDNAETSNNKLTESIRQQLTWLKDTVHDLEVYQEGLNKNKKLGQEEVDMLQQASDAARKLVGERVKLREEYEKFVKVQAKAAAAPEVVTPEVKSTGGSAKNDSTKSVAEGTKTYVDSVLNQIEELDKELSKYRENMLKVVDENEDFVESNMGLVQALGSLNKQYADNWRLIEKSRQYQEELNTGMVKGKAITEAQIKYREKRILTAEQELEIVKKNEEVLGQFIQKTQEVQQVLNANNKATTEGNKAKKEEVERLTQEVEQKIKAKDATEQETAATEKSTKTRRKKKEASQETAEAEKEEAQAAQQVAEINKEAEKLTEESVATKEKEAKAAEKSAKTHDELGKTNEKLEATEHKKNKAIKQETELQEEDAKATKEAEKQKAALDRMNATFQRNLLKYYGKNKEYIDGDSEASKKLREEYEALQNTTFTSVLDADKAMIQFKEHVDDVKRSLAESKAVLIAEAAAIAQYAEAIRAKVIDGLFKGVTKIIQEVYKGAVKLDEELVEIRKVTDFSESELGEFVNRIKDIGNATATATDELLKASAVFARSGYTKEQIELLTEESAVLKNVSDGIDNIEQAAQVLIATMKAYKVEAEDVRKITDTFNAISNKSAISFDDLAEGVQRVGAVFAQQGTSIAQLSGLLTGANEVLQDISKTSNGLKTIAQRLRNIDEAIEDGIGTAKLEELFTTVTSRYGQVVRITDEATGQLRGTFDILQDLAGVWNQLTSDEQQLLGEKIAGKNQITVLQALLQNWESVSVAIGNAEEAAGSAEREQQAYLNSLTGAVEQFHNAVNNLYMTAVNSNLIKSFVQFGTQIVQIVDKIGLGTIALGAAISGISLKVRDVSLGIQKINSITAELTKKKGLGGVLDFLVNINKYNKDIKDRVVDLNSLTVDEQKQLVELLELDARRNTTVSQRKSLHLLENKAGEENVRILRQQILAEETLNGLRSIGLGILTMVGSLVLSKIIEGIRKANEEAKNAVYTAKEELNKASSSIKEIQEEIDAIYKTIDESGGQVLQSQLDDLDELARKLEEQRVIQEKWIKDLAKLLNESSGYIEDQIGYWVSFYDKALDKTLRISTEDIKTYLDDNSKLVISKYDEALLYFAENRSAFDYLTSVDPSLLNNNVKNVLSLFSTLNDELTRIAAEKAQEASKEIEKGITTEKIADALRGVFSDAFDSEKMQYDWEKIWSTLTVEDAKKAVEALGYTATQAMGQTAAGVENVVDKWKDYKENVDEVEQKLSDYAAIYNEATGKTSASQLLKIIDNWDKYNEYIVVTNGQLEINKDLIVAKAQTQLDATKADLISKKNEVDADIAVLKTLVLLRDAAVERANKSIEGSNKRILSLKNEATAIREVSKLETEASGVSWSGKKFKVSPTQFKTIDTISKYGKDLDTALTNATKRSQELARQIEVLNNLNLAKTFENISRSSSGSSSSTSKQTDTTKKATDATKDLIKEEKERDEILKEITASIEELNKAIDDSNKELEENKAALEAAKTKLAEYEAQLKDTTNYYEVLRDAMKDIIEEEIKALEAENEAINENIQYYKARIQLAQEYYAEQIAALEKEKDFQEANYDAEIDRLKNEQERRKEINEERIEALKEQQKAQKEANDAEKERLKNAQKQAKADNEAKQKAVDKLIDALKEQYDLDEKANKEAQAAIDDRITAINEEISALEEAAKARETEVTQAQKLLNIEKARLAAEKAKDAYEAAKQSKTVRTYDAERGWTYTANQSDVASAYGSYQSAQASYQSLLDDLKKEQEEAALAAQKDALQQQINTLKADKAKLADDLAKEKEDISAQEKAYKAQIKALKEQKDLDSEYYDKLLEELDKKATEDDDRYEFLIKQAEAKKDADDNHFKELIAKTEEQKTAVVGELERQIKELQDASDRLGKIETNVERAVDKYLNDAQVNEWVKSYIDASDEDRLALEKALEDIWTSGRREQISNEAEIERLNGLLDKIDNMLVETNKLLETDTVKKFLEMFKSADEAGREDIISDTREAYLKDVGEINAKISKTNEEIDGLTLKIDTLQQTIDTLNDLLSLQKEKKTAREKEIEEKVSASKESYASGGVVDSGLLNKTGMLSDRVKVHGTPSNPELILNGRQQANLLYRLSKQRPSVSNNQSNQTSSMYIANLTIQADSQDTLSGLLLQAKQLALVSR